MIADAPAPLNGQTMYDSVSVASYPADTMLALGYLDGQWPDLQEVQARFPNAVVLGVTTTVAGNANARVYDCEKGDGNAFQAVQWAQMQIHLGRRPTIYCSRVGTAGYGWPWVQAAVKAAKMDPTSIDYGIADATGEAHLVAGSVFTQWGQGGNGAYDISTTNGIWPGSTTPVVGKKEDDMALYVTNAAGTGFIVATDLTSKVGLEENVASVLLATGQYAEVPKGGLPDSFIDAIPLRENA